MDSKSISDDQARFKRAEAERALGNRERLLDLSFDAIMVRGAADRIVYWNQGASEAYGYTREEALGQVPHELLKTEFPEPLDDILAVVHRNGRWTGELTHTRKDGSKIFVSSRWALDKHGDSPFILESNTDITARKRAEDALRESEQRLRFHVENTPLAVVEWGPDFRLSRWSGGAERIFGWRADEVLGKRMDEFRWIYDEDMLAVNDVGRGLRHGTEPSSVSHNRNYRKDGSVIHCEWYNSSLVDESGKLVSILSLVLDVTERERTAEALMRSEKLVVLGRMAATIAHEINNPLAAVTNTVYLARTDAECSESVRRHLKVADEELRRISHITRQALGFYRESSAASRVSVGTLLDESIDLFRSKISARNVTVERQYDAILQVVGVAGELRQVFSNLLANSLDAVPEGGTIVVRGSHYHVPGRPDLFVRVTVADNGKGIGPAFKTRIFEPLYTTKGQFGTGLGLWVTRQLVEKHGGSIRVRSAVRGRKRGTTFSLLLPAEGAPDAAPVPRQQASTVEK